SYNVRMPAAPVCTAELEDADALVRLINLAFRAERPFVEGDRVDLAGVRSLFNKGSVLVVRNGESLVGCVHVEIRGELGHLGLLSVDPGHQGKGLGAQLMSAAEDQARSAGCKAVDLRFINLRTELQRFYAHLG